MTDRRIKAKVRALFALAEDAGATSDEAASAMAKARALMLKYEIEDYAESMADSIEIGFGKVFTYGSNTWVAALGGAIAILYGCRFASAADGATFIGTRNACEAADVTFESLYSQISEATLLAVTYHKVDKRRLMSFIDSFALGCVEAVALRVYAIVYKPASSCRALVVVDAIQQKLDGVMQDLGGQPTALIVPPDGPGTRSGLAIGKVLEIQKEVS